VAFSPYRIIPNKGQGNPVPTCKEGEDNPHLEKWDLKNRVGFENSTLSEI
jgi:hypothetical protein